MTRPEAMEFIKSQNEKFNHTRQHQWKFNITFWSLIVLGIYFLNKEKFKIPFLPLCILCGLFLIAHYLYALRIQVSLSHCKKNVDYLLNQLNQTNREDLLITLDFEKARQVRKKKEKEEEDEKELTKYGPSWIFFQCFATAVLLAMFLLVAYYKNKAGG